MQNNEKIEEMRRSIHSIINFCPTSLGFENSCMPECDFKNCFKCWTIALTEKIEEEEENEDI